MFESGRPLPNGARLLRGGRVVADHLERLAEGSELGQQVG